MVKWIALLLTTGLVAALLANGEVAPIAMPVAWVSLLSGFAVGLVLVLFDRRSPMAWHQPSGIRVSNRD